MDGLKGQKVIIVGGGSGIGFGIAQRVFDEGGDVVLAGRSEEKLKTAAKQIGLPESAKLIAADITNEEDVIRLFESAGEFDHLITTAASLSYAPIRDMDIADMRRSIDSKLLSSMLLAKHGCSRIRSGGSITFTSGIAADRPMPRASAVAAVNSGLAGLARALAVELAPTRVNVISPGWVSTPIWETVAGDNRYAMFEQMAMRLPAGRIGLPGDIAEAALFLMRSEFTTGIVLPVDGGHRLV